MITKPFDSDPVAGLLRKFHYDETTDESIIETEFDVTALVEANKYLANTEEAKHGSEFRRVASLPLVIYYQLKRDGTLDDPKKFAAWLNSNENRYFRTDWSRV